MKNPRPKFPLPHFPGRHIGRLVLKQQTINHRGEKSWLCICECGNEHTVTVGNLTHGNALSCGCGRWGNNVVHGHTKNNTNTPTYRSYRSMISRCYLSSMRCFPNYGGRGVEVCDEWRHSFKSFLADMGPRPDGTTLDRINPNGNYEPSNCRWATISEQARNRRNSRTLTLDGITLNISDWAERTGLSSDLIWARHRRLKWSVREVLTTPAVCQRDSATGRLLNPHRIRS